MTKINALQLADGSRISVETGKSVREEREFIHVPDATEAVATVTRARMRLSDLPSPPQQMNVISVVVLYSLVGLSNEEIAIALNLTADQVGRIKTCGPYSEMLDATTKAILENDTDDVRHMFAQHAKSAARGVLSLMSSEDEKVALKAAQDILDRAGHRPVDVTEHRLLVDGGLRIEYVEKKTADIPTVIDGAGHEF